MSLRVSNSQSTASKESLYSVSSVESLPKNQTERLAEIQALCQKERIGVVAEHLIKLQTLSQEKNCIISIRPVDLMATDLIENGYPTKGFHIKGKSANWGPQAAFICAKQEFSKLADQSKEKQGEYNQQVTACLDDGYAQKIPLEITKARLNRLIENNVIDEVKYDAQRHPIELAARTPKGVIHKFELLRSDKEPEVYLVRHNGEPIEVLAPPGENKKPLTADYDIFMIAPLLEDFGPQDMLALHDVSHVVYKARIDNYPTSPEQLAEPLQTLYTNPDKFYEPMDKEFGNASPRNLTLIPEINQRLVGKGEPVVHHSTDTGSPATDMEANFPLVFTLPKRLGQFDEICVIRNVDELKTLIQTAKNEGYYVQLNPLWEKEITDIRSSDFKNAQKVAAAHWKQV